MGSLFGDVSALLQSHPWLAVVAVFAGGWQVLAPGRSFPTRQPVAQLDRIVASYPITGSW